MVELSTFDIWLYVILGIIMSVGGFFLFHFYNVWSKRQLIEHSDSSFIRGSALVWFISFGITLTGVGITYLFGFALIHIYFY